ncbi:hypothetical protein L1987_64035 [Smallanthus sonchifolius]|uniref:Uncharacterized protein n=1 Tax=Smallanthus sonchifolius TaxID=185202 RepID=A0ACB9CES7_9ASTR|nr:hypothetical protein L1987_64035 [Smallanthus sonchifolius]
MKVNSHDNFQLMPCMYEMEKELTVYVTTVKLQNSQAKTYRKKIPTIKMNSSFDNAVGFRRVWIHYALTNEFQYFIEKSVHIECKWRIHASVKQDGITFQVKTFVEAHSCTQSNKGVNMLASQGWIASVIGD